MSEGVLKKLIKLANLFIKSSNADTIKIFLSERTFDGWNSFDLIVKLNLTELLESKIMETAV